MFSTLSKTEIITFVTFNLSSANAFSLVWSKILLCGNGLRLYLVYNKYLLFPMPDPIFKFIVHVPDDVSIT